MGEREREKETALLAEECRGEIAASVQLGDSQLCVPRSQQANRALQGLLNRERKDTSRSSHTTSCVCKDRRSLVILAHDVKIGLLRLAIIFERIYQRVQKEQIKIIMLIASCLLYTSPSPRDLSTSRMPSSA